MYRRIMVPVDLAHVERLDKAITTATDLAKHYDIPICFVGVTAETPTEVAHTPGEFAEKLRAFGAAQSKRHNGLEIETAAYPSHDPAVDLDKTLIAAAKDKGADLIVMASHVPGLPEHIFASNAGAVAAHSGISVFVVR
jgi:nucleotide-binding universal stress UspA family protein